MTQPQISVIVPIYGVERYLRECVDSILAQTFKDFELLLIDDGSPDGSPAICDEYEKLDSRVRVFHKPNGGVGSARNVGIENAKGKWIAFIDADDWLGERYLENFKIDKLDSSVDFVITNSFNQFDKVRLLWENGDLFYNESNFEEFYPHLVSRDGLYLSPWGRLFLIYNIRKNNIRFAENFSFAEDCHFNFEYFKIMNAAYVVDDCSYNYRYNESSITHTKKPYCQYTRSLDVYLYNLKYFIDKYPSNEALEEYFVKFHIIGNSLSILDDLYRRKYPRKKRKEVVRKVNSYIALSEGKYKKHLKDLPSHRVKIWMVVNLPFAIYDLSQKLLVKVK